MSAASEFEYYLKGYEAGVIVPDNLLAEPIEIRERVAYVLGVHDGMDMGELQKPSELVKRITKYVLQTTEAP